MAVAGPRRLGSPVSIRFFSLFLFAREPDTGSDIPSQRQSRTNDEPGQPTRLIARLTGSG